MDEQIDDAAKTTAATNAISIYGQGGAGTEEFPVLKAFQQYIDAEQAKARKRMLGLSIFFIVLMVLVVVTFVTILSASMHRTEQLSDRLLDILRERQAQPVQQIQPPAPAPVVVNPPNQQNEMLKPILERLAGLAEAIKEKAATPPPVVEPPKPSETQLMIQRKLEEERALIEAERAKLKAEQEQARKDDIERQRRKLYPEYYAQKDRAEAAAAEAERALKERPATLPAPTAPTQQAAPETVAPAASKEATAPLSNQDAASDVQSAPMQPSSEPKSESAGNAPQGTVDYVLPVGTKKATGVKWRLPIPE